MITINPGSTLKATIRPIDADNGYAMFQPDTAPNSSGLVVVKNGTTLTNPTHYSATVSSYNSSNGYFVTVTFVNELVERDFVGLRASYVEDGVTYYWHEFASVVEEGVSDSVAVVNSPVVDDGLIIVVEGDTYDGVLNDKISWAVTRDYTGATIDFVVWRQDTDGARTIMLTDTGTVVSSVLVEIPDLTATFTDPLEFSGIPAFEKLQFACTATLAAKEYTIALGDFLVKERRPGS